jgi:hypothetical protein
VWLWVLAALGLLLAVMALAGVRRLTRRLDSLNQSYWELRYDYTRLRAQVARLDPELPEAEPPQPAPSDQVTFVPLSTMKKKPGDAPR